MMQDLYAEMEEIGAPPRMADAMAFVAQAGSITRGDYMDITGVSPMTASRDLAWLVKEGSLVAEGKTRSRVYRPSPEGSARLERRAAQIPLPEADHGSATGV
jgi:DeoR/GlpR family transcriptional regulator of sugar metabolism